MRLIAGQGAPLTDLRKRYRDQTDGQDRGFADFVRRQALITLERAERIAKRRAMMERADVTNAEKYRRILEAYQIENDYGRTLEAYKGKLDLGDRSFDVDFLRIGRLALLQHRGETTERVVAHRRTSMPCAAMKRLASPMLYSAKWKMEAARAASALVSLNTSRKSFIEPAPPEAMTGI